MIGSEVIFLFRWPASDKCVCSSVSRGALNQERPQKHNEFCGGEADKRSICLTIFLSCLGYDHSPSGGQWGMIKEREVTKKEKGEKKLINVDLFTTVNHHTVSDFVPD